GGGILNNLGSLTVSDSELSGNTSMRAGGAIEENSIAGSLLTITNSDLINNSTASAPGNGGGLHISGAGDSNITGGNVSGNTASREGGGLWNGAGIMTVDGTTIDANIATGPMADDGGAGIFNNGGTLNVLNATISNNIADGAAGSGGGIFNNEGTLTVTDSDLTGNTSMRAGGAIEERSVAGSLLTLTNTNLMNNSTASAPGNGGGIHNASGGDVIVMRSTISSNTANGAGAGIYNNGASFDLNAVTVAMNNALSDGGGIQSETTTSLKNTLVALNTGISGVDVNGNFVSNDYNLIGTDDAN